MMGGMLIQQLYPFLKIKITEERIGDELVLILLKYIKEIIDLHLQLTDTVINILETYISRFIRHLRIGCIFPERLIAHEERLHFSYLLRWCGTVLCILAISDPERIRHMLYHLVHIHFPPMRRNSRIDAGQAFCKLVTQKVFFIRHVAKYKKQASCNGQVAHVLKNLKIKSTIFKTALVHITFAITHVTFST